MKRRTVLTVSGTALGVVLLLAAKPHQNVSLPIPVVAAPPQPVPSGSGSASGSGSSGASTSGASSSGSTPSGSSTSGSSTSRSAAPVSGVRSVTGGAVDTRWGPVQVKVTFNGSKITAVDVLQQPDGNDRDMEINAQAIPILTQEALAAQSATIDAVSGASYTSEGYIASLQSALDAAK
ncbi:FMN-binding protein [Streptacidiphilus sp. EB129]|uniref:FMN-binding protein n=1 Tax=Streptacidiphilus sp. EB129 TaxID=3156262 RepID=UPI003513EC13